MNFLLYNTGMFIRPCYKKSNGKKLAYWTLVESYRTAQGPRQRIVAYLGQLKEPTRRGVKNIADEKNTPEDQGTFDNKSKPAFVQARLFNDDPLNDNPLDNAQLEPEWIEINANGVRVENEKSFGGPWLAL